MSLFTALLSLLFSLGHSGSTAVGTGFAAPSHAAAPATQRSDRNGGGNMGGLIL